MWLLRMPRSSFARLIVDCSNEVGRNSAHPVLSFPSMTVSFWQRSSKNLPEIDCDLCIIGAGITGASTARWLKRVAPRMRVAIVEARTIAAGASGRNAGMVLAGLADHYDRMIEVLGRAVAREAWQATLDHQRHLSEIFPDDGHSVRLERCGSWRVGFEASEREHLELSAALLRDDGFPAEYHAADPLDRGFHGALGIDSDAGVHPVLVVEALIAAAGADVYRNCEVIELKSEDGHVSVQTSGATFRARRVIIAANAYAPRIDSFFELLVTPHRGQILVTAPVGRRVLDRLVYAHHGYIYFRQLPDYRFLIGGWRHEFAEREMGFADETSADVQQALGKFLGRYFPELSGVAVESRWAGTMGFSPDGLPIVGVLPRDERISYAVGFTGHGFGLALEVTRRLVNLILAGEPCGIFGAARLKTV